jgi:hypothetical protein
MTEMTSIQQDYAEFAAQWSASLVPKDIESAQLYRVSKLTMFEHNRGVAWKANIHFKDELIGQVSNEGVGGCNSYQFSDLVIRDKFESFVEENYPTTVYDRDDHFIEYLIDRDGLG